MTDDPLDDLLDDLDSHGDLTTTEQTLTIRIEERRYGKPMTIVEGFDLPTSELRTTASDLKRSLGTGGTAGDDRVELQGDHRGRLPALLRERGYDVTE